MVCAGSHRRNAWDSASVRGSAMVTRSLHIGINYERTNNALRGCINDARDWANHFRPIVGEPATLLEEKATKAGISNAITNLLKGLAAGDSAIITFSGHGTYIPDQTGDEADRRDEALCPYDLNKSLLLDDELFALLSECPQGARVLLITDCCHSGTMSRSGQVESDGRSTPRYIPFAELTECMCGAAVDKIQGDARRARARSRVRSRGPLTIPGLVHWSGCKDDEVSFDATINGRACGAFSNAALAILNSGLPRGTTHEVIQRLMASRLPSRNYRQSPQFNGYLGLVVPGFELPMVPTLPPAVSLGGPDIDVVVGGWRATAWEKLP